MNLIHVTEKNIRDKEKKTQSTKHIKSKVDRSNNITTSLWIKIENHLCQTPPL